MMCRFTRAMHGPVNCGKLRMRLQQWLLCMWQLEMSDCWLKDENQLRRSLDLMDGSTSVCRCGGSSWA
jgi:hypothetical protein